MRAEDIRSYFILLPIKNIIIQEDHGPSSANLTEHVAPKKGLYQNWPCKLVHEAWPVYMKMQSTYQYRNVENINFPYITLIYNDYVNV